MDTLQHTLTSLSFLSAGFLAAIVTGAAVYLLFLVLTNLVKDEAYRGTLRREVFQGFLVCLPLAYLAWIVGYLTGFSRSGAVSDLVPAVLTFFGASAAILSLKFALVMQTSMEIFAFSTCLFVGATLGSSQLALEEEHKKRLHLEYLKEQADVEAVIKAYRETLGLEWPPNYSLPTGSAKK